MRLPGYTPKIILGFLVALFFVLLALNLLKPDQTAYESSAKRFFVDAYAGKYANAFKNQCTRAQREFSSVDDFASRTKAALDEAIAKNGKLGKVSVTGSKKHSNDTATVELKFPFEKKTDFVQVSMGHENGWQTCGYVVVAKSGLK